MTALWPAAARRAARAGRHPIGVHSERAYLHKHRRHGVNMPVVTESGSHVLWFTPALPGRTHDLTTARTHRIIRICDRPRPARLGRSRLHRRWPLDDTLLRRPPGQALAPTQQAANHALLATRAAPERSVARLKPWPIFRHTRRSPDRQTSIAKAVLTLERHR
ncbi:transposase family protein [Streptomyces massasporeus]|uniref:transposase family protein n=1 Tax=Streptomyces massasporeus TaxID=67324 RepID=UPI0036A0E722